MSSDDWTILNTEQVRQLREDNERMREALQEIRDVAACSEGVEFYVMIADRGLGNAV